MSADPIPAPVTDFCPVYEKDGNEFIVLMNDFRADDEETAWQIAMGSMLVECVLWGCRYAKRIVSIDRSNFPHRNADLAGVPVAIITGPYFEEAAND